MRARQLATAGDVPHLVWRSETRGAAVAGLTKRPEGTADAGAGVREGPDHHGGHSAASPDVYRLAHPRQPFPIVLNENWQIVDHPLQWVLQQRKGNRRSKNTGWHGRLFCRTRSGLLNLVAEYCGQVAPQARAALDAFPEWHR